MRDRGSILVTGAAGFIGSSVVHALNARGEDDIIVADVMDRSEKWRNLSPLKFADYIEADELRRRVEQGGMPSLRAVIHLGACSSTTETDAAYLIRNNFDYTRVLCAWALGVGARFVYASSAATYGALEGELSDEADLDTLRPLNMYGYSKQLFDQYATRQGWLEQVAGIKYFNVFGPNEYHKGDMRSMVHKAHEQIAETGRVRLFRSDRPEFRDGEQRRDFVYARDAVAMTLHLVDTPEANGLFNVGSGRAHTWLDLVTPVFHAMGRTPEIEFIDMPAELRGKYQYMTCARLTRIRASGYEAPITPLAEAVGETVRYLTGGRRLGE